MIQQIKDAFKEHLAEVDWMDPTTLALATEKADAITDMIGFPDFILNEKKLNKRYEGVMDCIGLRKFDRLTLNPITFARAVGYQRGPVLQKCHFVQYIHVERVCAQT